MVNVEGSKTVESQLNVNIPVQGVHAQSATLVNAGSQGLNIPDGVQALHGEL